MSTDKENNTPLNRATYMQEYYRHNKDRILAQRKRRYQNDEEYRDKRNQMRRKTRQVNNERMVIQSVDLDTEKEIIEEVSHLCNMKVLHPQERHRFAVCRMFSLSNTAMALGVEKTKLDHWIYLKKIPEPRYRNKQNWRLYTEDEVLAMKNAFAWHRRHCRNNNYVFRLNKKLMDRIDEKFSKLVGGVKPERFAENDE